MEIEREWDEYEEKPVLEDVNATGEDLKDAIDDLHAITEAENERQAKYALRDNYHVK